MDTSLDKRNYIVDILKIMACFFVFRIHMGWGSASYVRILSQFVECAVPIFIFLTSYNYTQSCLKSGATTLKQLYSFESLAKKFFRLIVPYLVFAIVQLILILTLKPGYKWGNVAISMLGGGYGPGNYYLVLMFQVILIFPLLYYFNKKRPVVTWFVCLIFYFAYNIFMTFVFPDDPHNVTTVGGIIYKWTVFRFVFLLDSGIYFCLNRDKIKIYHLLILILADLIPFILSLTTSLPTIYARGIPNNFFVISIVGICLKLFKNASFGKLNGAIAYLGKATWHIFLFQQLYFWLIGILGWRLGFGYLSFPICFFGGLLFYTVHTAISKAAKAKKQAR